MQLKLNSFFCFMIVLATGCSQLSDMTKMKDTTQHMSDTTDGMAQTTAGMAVTTDKMAATTDGMSTTENHLASTTDGVAATSDQLLALTSDLYQNDRQGNSYQVRVKALDEMKSAISLADKVSQAGTYMQAFESQLWTDEGRDTQEVLDGLYDYEMQEFTRILRDYLPQSMPKFDPLTLTDPRLENLYALAASLNLVNKNAQPGALSMLDLIKNVIQLKNQVDTGKTVEASLQDWQREGLLNYPQLVYLLQMRVNFLGCMTVGQLTNLLPDPSVTSKIDSSGLPKGIAARAYDDLDFYVFYGTQDLKKVLVSWNADFSKVNLEQIVQYTTWMNWADSDAAFLKSVGEPVYINSYLQDIFEHMKIVRTDDAKDTSLNKTLWAPTLTSFTSSYQAFDSVKN